MMKREAQGQTEVAQQVWTYPSRAVGNEQLCARPMPDLNKPLPPHPEEDDFEDDEFGEFQTATIPGNESWVSVTYPQAARDDSPPPSPLPRGYLRSSQNIDRFYAPMDLYSDADDTDDLSSYENSFGGYSLLHGSSESAISPQIRHGTSTQRMWPMSKQAFAKLSTIKKLKGATTGWMGKEKPMAVETITPKHKDCASSAVPEVMLQDQVKEEVTTSHGPKIEHLPLSWMEAEREAWNS